MKMSARTKEELLALTPEEKWDLVCGNIRDDGASAKVAILLGGNPVNAILRAETAAELYRAGRVEYIVASGGVKWDYEGEQISEADLMSRVLQQNGVPAEAIILDNEARTTKENMICSTLQINRSLTFKEIDRVIIVTSLSHMQRSIALAKALLPRKVEVFSYPYIPAEGRDEWLKSEENCRILDTAIRLTRDLIADRIVDDIEVD